VVLFMLCELQSDIAAVVGAFAQLWRRFGVEVWSLWVARFEA
jgi:hypothetical protein